jgi:hypothetical protein
MVVSVQVLLHIRCGFVAQSLGTVRKWRANSLCSAPPDRPEQDLTSELSTEMLKSPHFSNETGTDYPRNGIRFYRFCQKSVFRANWLTRHEVYPSSSSQNQGQKLIMIVETQRITILKGVLSTNTSILNRDTEPAWGATLYIYRPLIESTWGNVG